MSEENGQLDFWRSLGDIANALTGDTRRFEDKDGDPSRMNRDRESRSAGADRAGSGLRGELQNGAPEKWPAPKGRPKSREENARCRAPAPDGAKLGRGLNGAPR